MICLNSQSIFSSLKKSYIHHIDVEHEIWLYPLYIRYLIDKDEEDFSGDEINVWNNYINGNTDWMPKHDSRYLILVR